jgi:hypothetical protein
LEGTPVAKAETWDWAVYGAVPFTVFTRIDCSPTGSWEALSPRNQQALIRAEAREVERIFATGIVETGGAIRQYPHLASTAAVVDGEDVLQLETDIISATPANIVLVVGALETAMRDCYPGIATLHVTLEVAEIMASQMLLITRDGQAFTPAGSRVVIGGGYPGTSPAGASVANVSWIYATGSVFFQREATPHSFTPVQSLDRNVNTVSMIAERTYVVGYDCCLLAAPVDLAASVTGDGTP